MKSLLIFNPVSGQNENRSEYIGNIIINLTKNGNEIKVYQTQGKGDAEEYIKLNDVNKYEKIICCGGDGTLHEVINGLMKKSIKNSIAYIPMGSTNDYAKNLGITKENALECANTENICEVDIGCMNGEYFNYVAAFGIFTNISFVTPQYLKNTFGYFAYLLEGVKQLTNISSKHIRFLVDGIWKEGNIILGMITNTFSVAGIKSLNKSNVKLNDGLMEYLFIKFPKNIVELQTIIRLLLNEKIDERFMYYGQFKTMIIESEEMEWTLDGENGGSNTYAEFNIYPRAMNIVCNVNN